MTTKTIIGRKLGVACAALLTLFVEVGRNSRTCVPWSEASSGRSRKMGG